MVRAIPAAAKGTGGHKPALIYLPGIELSGYTLHRQIAELQADFELHYLNVPLDDRTPFDGLVDVVSAAVERLAREAEEEEAAEAEEAKRAVYVVGESFGGALGLAVALRHRTARPSLSGVALINPATSVQRSWAARLPALLDALAALPARARDTAYNALAAPILLGISPGDEPLQLVARREDAALGDPLSRAAALLPRLRESQQQLPLLFQFGDALPADTLAFRLSELLAAAKALEAESAALRKLALPVDLFPSTADRLLPSLSECRRLKRLLPNAALVELRGCGHVPLLDARVSLAQLLRETRLVDRRAAPRKDYVADFAPPTEEAIANATRQLRAVRRAVSPVWYSTQRGGRRIAGLGGVPALEDGAPPVLFVGNHQLYGFSDLPLVVEELLRERGTLVRALAHPIAFNRSRAAAAAAGEPPPPGGGAGGLVDFETFGAVPVSPRALFKLLQRGAPTLLYPGGVREAFKSTKKGEAYRLFWPAADESADFARVAARFNATIVPVAAVGAEEGFNMLLDADELLSLPYFGERLRESAGQVPVGRPGERFVSPLSLPKLPERYYFLFGEPIPTAELDASDREACVALYAKVQADLEAAIEYVLDKRQDDPYRAPLPRIAVEASWGWTRQAPSFRP